MNTGLAHANTDQRPLTVFLPDPQPPFPNLNPGNFDGNPADYVSYYTAEGSHSNLQPPAHTSTAAAAHTITTTALVRGRVAFCKPPDCGQQTLRRRCVGADLRLAKTAPSTAAQATAGTAAPQQRRTTAHRNTGTQPYTRARSSTATPQHISIAEPPQQHDTTAVHCSTEERQHLSTAASRTAAHQQRST